MRRIKLTKDNELIVFNTIILLIIRGGALIVALFTTPYYIKYFNNNEILGVWFTLLSVMNWVLNFDFGISNGMRNKLVEVFIQGDTKKTKDYISSGYITLCVFSVLLFTVMELGAHKVDWNSFLNISSESFGTAELLKTISIVLLSVCLQFIMKIINSIFYALQNSAVPGLLNLISNAGLLFYVITTVNLRKEGNAVTLAMVYLIASNLPLVLASVIMFLTSLKNCRPSIMHFKPAYAKEILGLGCKFLWLQIMQLLLCNSNEFFITRLLEPALVVEYQIYFKVFGIIGSIVAIISTPIWSAATKAKTEKNTDKIRMLTRQLYMIGGLASFCEFLLIPGLQIIFKLWLGKEAISVNFFTATIYAIHGSVLLWVYIVSSIANGLEELKIQIKFFIVGFLFYIVLTMVMSNILYSSAGIVLANALAMLPYCIFIGRKLSRYEL